VHNARDFESQTLRVDSGCYALMVQFQDKHSSEVVEFEIRYSRIHQGGVTRLFGWFVGRVSLADVQPAEATPPVVVFESKHRLQLEQVQSRVV
jgi:hypothetical protein